MAILTSFLSGLVFGLGLIVSGMTNPANVLGFLDLAGHWNPSLALVMLSAVGVGMVGMTVAARRRFSFIGIEIQLPQGTSIDRRLILGSSVFGIGWGLGGFCPGPGVVALGTGEIRAVYFVVAMLAGMSLFEMLERQGRQRGGA